MPVRPASLADVAALAGVSSGTVSRALSRPDMISDTTRARVLAAAERLGYVANGSARALAMRRTLTIGAIVPRFGTSSFPTMVQGLESTLAAEGYTLLLSAPEHSSAREPAILRTLLERGVDAVALLGAEQSAQTFSILNAHRIPFVLMWARNSREADCIGFDERAAAALVIDHLADLGHRDVGFIGGSTSDNERARERFRGIVEALARRGMSLCPQALIETEYGFREGFDAMQAIVGARAPVSAVVCGNDYLAAGALSALDRAGIPVPQALSIASFNDNEFAAYLHPPLTSVHLPIGQIGEAAGRHLIARLRGERPALPAALPVELVVRASTGVATLGA
ncbi:MAG: LacI family DNA-binding transcriptional regulator [Burkholderiaceae bacterium]|nr:LacI family DNA-binding transcriptional regulator [Burkholderiaceae bacterium]